MTEFKTFPTKQLQVESLIQFAKALGYVPVNSSRLCQGFVNSTKSGYISFELIIQLHNRKKSDCISEDFYDRIHQYKLVEQVKLQRDKSQPDGVKVQNHMVKLTEKGKELYEHLRSL